MAITTDSLVTVESGGVTYDTIGLSKTLNNYTAAEIWDYIFCSASSNNLYHIGYGSGGMNYYTYQGDDNYVPFELQYAATNHNNFYYHPEQVMNNPDGLYMRVIWLQRTSNGSDNYITSSNGSNYKLITMFNAPHYVYECNTPRLVDNDHGSTSWNAGGYLYYSDGGSLYYYDDVTAETPTRISINRAVPAIIFKDNTDKVYIIPYRQNMSVLTSVQNTQSGGWNPATAYNFYDFTGTNCIAFPVVIDAAYQYCSGSTGELTSPYSDGSRLPEGSGIYPRPMYATTTINHLIAFFSCGGSDLTLGFRVNNYFRDVENCKKFFSLAGLHFKADKIYKPIIEGGYVTGFTDQLATPSDLDTWDGKTKHDIPPTPPGPGPSPLESDEQVTGGTYYGGGFLKIYACTKAELDHLQSWMSGGAAGTGGTNPTTIQPNMTPMQQMVGLTGFPIIVEPESSLYNTTFTFTDADNTLVNTGWTTQKAQLSAEEFYTGTLTVKTWEKDNNQVPWMDYSAIIECYVPFCGVVGLDPQVVMGKDLKVRMWVDYVTGDCSAYVECNKDGQWHPVAYMTGHVGASEAMSAAAYGQLMGAREANAHAMTQAVIGGVKNLITGSISSVTSGAVAGMGNARTTSMTTPQGSTMTTQIGGINAKALGSIGAMHAVGSAVDLGVGLTQQSLDNRYNYEVAKNSLGTTIMGSFGSSSAWHFPITPYIKVTYPTPLSKDVTNYGKTYGVPVHKTGTLNDYHGYTICNNVDTSGISTATSEEQALIKQFLESGVYLP